MIYVQKYLMNLFLSFQFLKFLVLFLVLGVCLALPVEDVKHPVPVVVPGGAPPHVAGHPPKPQKPDDSDLKTDPSTWWHTYYHHQYPVYYYNVHT